MGDQEITESFNHYIEPSNIPFRFGAPGWWVLAALLTILILVISFLFVRYYYRNLYRKQALRYLAEITQSDFPDSGLHDQVYKTAILIKRVAMARYGRNPVAGLSGEAWIDWLNNRVKKNNITKFDKADAVLISDGIYGNKKLEHETVNPFLEKAKNWIRYHHAI